MYVKEFIRNAIRKSVNEVNAPPGDMIRNPSWWKIDSLDEADILGAWDFAWNGHNDQQSALAPFEGTLLPFVVNGGSPTYRHGDGIYFNGSSVLSTQLPEVNIEELSVIIQFDGAVQNGVLDAFYSHYLDSSHYTLQNRFSDSMVRWSCGNEDSSTVDVSGMITEGTYGTSGPHLYINGLHAISVPDTGNTTVNGLDFFLGAIFVGSKTQYIKATIQRILIVKRILTDVEQYDIQYRMKSGHEVGTWYVTDGVNHDNVIAAYDFQNAVDYDNALTAQVGPDLFRPVGGSSHVPGEGMTFGGNTYLQMLESVNLIPGEATMLVKIFSVGNTTDWRCAVGAEEGGSAVIIQHKDPQGACIYNGDGYNGGTPVNWIENPPILGPGWYALSEGRAYRDGALEPNELSVNVKPARDFTFRVGSLNDGQRFSGTISAVAIYDVPLTQEQIRKIQLQQETLL